MHAIALCNAEMAGLMVYCSGDVLHAKSVLVSHDIQPALSPLRRVDNGCVGDGVALMPAMAGRDCVDGRPWLLKSGKPEGVVRGIGNGE